MKHPYRHRPMDWLRDWTTFLTYCLRYGHKWGKNIPYCLNCGRDQRS